MSLNEEDELNVKMPFRQYMGLGVLVRQDFIEKARTAAMRISREKGEVTIDDVKEAVGELPEGVTDTIYGAVFKGRLWKRLGRRKRPPGVSETRPYVTVWRYGQRTGRWKR